jgi:hypothetical protein
VRDTTKFRFGTTSTGFTANAFAMTFGGGVDVRVTRRFWIRVVQADYVVTHFGNSFQNNFGLSGGFVFKFGKKI